MREQIIERVSAGGVVAAFSLPPGFTADPVAPPDCRIVGFKSVPDAQSETGHRKLYRYVLTSAAQKKLQNRAKRQLDKIERENKKALRTLLTAPSRISFYKTF